MKQKSNGKKVKNLVSFLLLLFFIFTANAQQLFKVKGVVTDGKEPLPNVTVNVKNSNKWTVTKNDGSYELTLPKGNYTIVFRALEREKTKAISIVENTTINIDFYDKVVSLDNVLISAVRVKADAPVTHSNLTKKEIEKRNLGQNVPTLLSYLPSVVSTSDDGTGVGYSGIRVRGSDAKRVNVTINGIPYNDPESQGTYWVNITDFSSSLKSIQLQRGVGTSTNGSSAFGASLNLLTDGFSEKGYVEISNAFGSYKTKKHNVKFSTGRLNNHFEFSGRLSKIDSDGYIDRAFSDLKSYFLQGIYNNEKRQIKALLFGNKEKTYQAWYGLSPKQLKENRKQNPYTYKNETDNYWQDHFQLHWTENINDNWSTSVGLNYTKGKGYYENYKNDRYSDYGLKALPKNDEGKENKAGIIRRKWLDNDFYVGTFTANYTSEKIKWITGGAVSHYKGLHFGTILWTEKPVDFKYKKEYYNNNSTKKEGNVFSKLTYTFSNQWSFFADLQYRFVNYKASIFNVNDRFHFFNPKTGVTFKLNNSNHFYASYARANREPNRDDYENNTKKPKPEKLNDFELGWRYAKNNLKVSTNLYYMLYKDQLVPTGNIDDVGAPIRSNSGDSYRLGVEVDAQIPLFNKWVIRPNIALSSNKNVNYYVTENKQPKNLGKTNIAYSPNIIAGNSITYSPADNWNITLLSKYVGEQFMSNTDLEASKLKDYFLNDFNINYSIFPKKIAKEVHLSLLVNNIFNKEYVSNGYMWEIYPYYYPQATTNFLAGITLKF